MIVALFETKTHVYAERNVRSTSPVSMAIVKLANVPIKTYSVVLYLIPQNGRSILQPIENRSLR